jgi:aspartyl-tRNA(Asn)/glutamyl-tRNA(Gln) amidotransferase subunit B
MYYVRHISNEIFLSAPQFIRSFSAGMFVNVYSRTAVLRGSPYSSSRHGRCVSYCLGKGSASIAQRHRYCQRLFSTSWNIDPISGQIAPARSSTAKEKETLYQVVVGLEIHIQLNHCVTKLFSPARTAASSVAPPPNTVPYLHPYDAAVPGVLPVLSLQAVRTAVLTAAVLNCRDIHRVSRFERKHYFYADLPHGYQITQQRWPIAEHGFVQCDAASSSESNGKSDTIHCRIDRIQLEQDTAKTTTVTRSDGTVAARIDLNRAGTALCEIVTAPDLRSATQAACVVRHIRQLLQYTNICSGQMQHGQLRVDCNINVVPVGQDGAVPHPRVEVKNLNSIQQVEDSIQYEARRQVEVLQQPALNDSVLLFEETRAWNAATKQTELLRAKDTAQDYRFLPEPDLPPVVIDETVLQGYSSIADFVAHMLPALPEVVKEEFLALGLSDYQARVLLEQPSAGPFFRTALKQCVTPQHAATDTAVLTANILCNVLFHLVKEDHAASEEWSMEGSKVSPKQLAEIVQMIQGKEISQKMAKIILKLLHEDSKYPTGTSPRQVAQERHLSLFTDGDILRTVCLRQIHAYPDKLQVYRQGGKLIGKMETLFIGKVMKATGENADPQRVREVVTECLKNVAAAKPVQR